VEEFHPDPSACARADRS